MPQNDFKAMMGLRWGERACKLHVLVAWWSPAWACWPLPTQGSLKAEIKSMLAVSALVDSPAHMTLERPLLLPLVCRPATHALEQQHNLNSPCLQASMDQAAPASLYKRRDCNSFWLRLCILLLQAGKSQAARAGKLKTKKEAEAVAADGFERVESAYRARCGAVEELKDVAKRLRRLPVIQPEIPTVSQRHLAVRSVSCTRREPGMAAMNVCREWGVMYPKVLPCSLPTVLAAGQA